MPLPKKIKKFIPLTEPKTLMGRREELLEKINRDGTYLPKSLLHNDLDRGMLDFVRDSLKTVVEGKVIPTVDIIITTQNWSQFMETWKFQNVDKNTDKIFYGFRNRRGEHSPECFRRCAAERRHSEYEFIKSDEHPSSRLQEN